MHTLAPSASNLATSHTNQERASTLNTSSVNRDRVHHASTTLPRRATSALVNRRARGPAQPSPVLPYRRDARIATIMQCLVAGAEVPTANILALVYPPHVCIAVFPPPLLNDLLAAGSSC